MNTKLYTMVILGMLSYAIFGANVKWNDMVLYEYQGEYYFEYQIARGQNLSLSVRADSAGRSNYTLHMDYGSGLFCGNWVVMAYGDIVMESTVRHLGEYFYHAEIDKATDGKEWTQTNPTVAGGDSIYLSFVSSSVEYSFEQLVDLMPAPVAYPNAVYGWIQLGVDRLGNLSLLGSAIDLDGGPMIVGGGSATPEPSGAFLLLLGMGALGLRRRRLPRSQRL